MRFIGLNMNGFRERVIQRVYNIKIQREIKDCRVKIKVFFLVREKGILVIYLYMDILSCDVMIVKICNLFYFVNF